MREVAALAEVTQTVQKQAKNKNRKSLQTLQTNSAEEKAKKNMVYTEEKNLQAVEKRSKSNETVIAAEKENAPVLRRSKRRPTITDTVNPPKEPKPSKSGAKNSKLKSKKSTSKSKKGNSTLVEKGEAKNNLGQTKLNFSPIRSILVENNFKDISESEFINKDINFSNESEKTALGTSVSSEVTEDSGFIPSAGTSQQMSPPPPIVFKSPYVKNDRSVSCDSESSILTIDSPPQSYWKDLAEQRRFALEKALHENELLHDQLAVLEAENFQLKQLVKEAEELAKVVKGIIE